MAIFKTIGNAFSEGWNKTKTTNQSYNEEYRIGKNIYYYSKEYSDKLDSANVSKLNDTVNIKVPGFNSIPNNIKSSDNGYEDFENPFKLSEEILMEATKNYKFIYKNDVEISGALGVNADGKVVLPAPDALLYAGFIKFINLPRIPLSEFSSCEFTSINPVLPSL